jgi:hypothetical protein
MAEYNDPKEPFKWTLFDPSTIQQIIDDPCYLFDANQDFIDLFSKNDSLAQRQKMSEWASPVSIRCSSL